MNIHLLSVLIHLFVVVVFVVAAAAAATTSVAWILEGFVLFFRIVERTP